MKKSYLLLIFSLVQLVLFGQKTKEEMTKFLNSATEQELLFECSSMIQEYYYYNAEKIVDKLLTIQPENSNYNYRKGYLIIVMMASTKVSLTGILSAIRRLLQLVLIITF